MKQLPKFITLMELCREQVQYGYFLSGINRQETSNLAEHHYLVAMIGWLLCEYINESENLVDTAEVIKICLIHDLGEIFGGDMAAPLSRKMPEIKKFSQGFEDGNFKILTSYLKPSVSAKFHQLFKDEGEKITNESLVAKVSDMLEQHFFLEHRNIQSKQKDDFYLNHIRPLVEKFTEPKIKSSILEFFEGFDQYVRNQGFTAGRWIIDNEK
jgi:putative hydrolase of HD superfamily